MVVDTLGSHGCRSAIMLMCWEKDLSERGFCE